MSKWKYIDEYDSLPASDIITCDIRDFNIICEDTEDIVNNIIGKIERFGHKTLSDCKFRRDEILGFLKTLEQENADKDEMLRLTTDIYSTWSRYLLFLKTPEVIDLGNRKEPVYIAVTNVNVYKSKWVPVPRTFIDENFDIDSLNFIKK